MSAIVTGKADLRLNTASRIVLGIIAGFVALLAVAPFLPLDPLGQDLLRALEPPSLAHPLGRDHLGRDVLARLVHGAPRSLGLATVAIAIAAGGGTVLGLIAASAGRLTSSVILRAADLMLAFPGILLALLFAGLLGGGPLPVLIGITLTLWPQFTRMSHAIAAGVLVEAHVEAARLAGFRESVVLRRHVLPPVLTQIAPLATLGLGNAVMTISSLGFLGLGLKPPVPEWGAMISELLPHLVEAPVQIAAPCLALFFSVLAATLAGRRIATRANRRSSP